MRYEMGIPENGLRRQQEQILVNLARQALDGDRPIDALSLLERVSSFWQQNLITLLILLTNERVEAHVKKRALALFHKQLSLCTNPTGLVHAALWVRNPVRMWQIPMHLQTMIDNRRKSVEPDWDGVWDNPGMGTSNVGLEIVKKSPEEVFDSNDCLIAASQVGNWNPWLKRYRELGGGLEEPRYMKLWIARTVARGREPDPQVKEMLKKYCNVGNFDEVRAFLRHITPTRHHFSRRDPNHAFAKYVLLVYCAWERLQHDASDWVHIAQSAVYLRHTMLQRIAQRGLAGVPRTPSAHRIFEELNAIHGEIRITGSSKKDIGPRGNPIWQSVYHQLPIDGNARKILIVYSNAEMAAF